MKENTFIPEAHWAVLEGETDKYADSTVRDYRARIKRRTPAAIQELIAVAKSDAIDNTDVFDPMELAALIRAVLGDPSNIQPRWSYEDGSQHILDYNYQHDVYNALNPVLERYRTLLHRPDEPPDWNESYGIMYEQDETAYPEED
jgi:hypothetical protein